MSLSACSVTEMLKVKKVRGKAKMEFISSLLRRTAFPEFAKRQNISAGCQAFLSRTS
jgi:hypothetical protein